MVLCYSGSNSDPDRSAVVRSLPLIDMLPEIEFQGLAWFVLCVTSIDKLINGCFFGLFSVCMACC